MSPQNRRLLLGGAIAFILLAAIVAAVTAIVVTTKTNSSTGANFQKDYVASMQNDNLMRHLSVLEDIAQNNNGSRSGTGFNKSASYVSWVLSDSNYNPEVQFFTLQKHTQFQTPDLQMTQPKAMAFIYGTDFVLFGNSPDANVNQVPVQLIANFGCNQSDYSAFTSGNVALVLRGVCTFVEKVQLAEQLNAAGAIVFNDGASSDRMGVMSPGLPDGVKIPALFGSYRTGIRLQAFLEVGAVSLSISSSSTVELVTFSNTITETEGGNANSIIMVGAHLDSVPAGPGINDDGSGSALVLELAVQLAQLRDETVNKIRFAWWGAEELGLLGSTHYVNSLSQEEQNNISVYINFDMLASPNFERGVLVPGSTPAPNGSAVLAAMFVDYFNEAGLPWRNSPFDGRSDYGPFLTAGIPASGIDTGADHIKTEEGRATFGGFANAPFDTCYHQACDTTENIDQTVYLQFAQAAATVLGKLAMQPDLNAFLGRTFPTTRDFQHEARQLRQMQARGPVL